MTLSITYEKGYRANKFGIPAGVFSGGPLPNTIEAYHGEMYSKILSLEATNAIENFFNGVAYNDPETLGPSIKDYLGFRRVRFSRKTQRTH